MDNHLISQHIPSQVALSALSPRARQALSLVEAQARKLAVSVWLVGGVVRDLLLGRTSEDLDLVLEGEDSVAALAEALTADGGWQVKVHPRFGTRALTREDGLRIDLAMAREEVYPAPASLPEVRPGTLAADLIRRDFSINAMALRLENLEAGRLEDPLGGLEDLQAKRLRVLHRQSFVDDPTRAFRAVRFEQRLGFALEAQTEAWLVEAVEAGGIRRLSDARVAHELQRQLEERNPGGGLRRLEGLGVLGELGLQPGLRAWRRFDRSLQAYDEVAAAAQYPEDSLTLAPLWQVRMLALAVGAGPLDRLLARLNVKGAEAARLELAVRSVVQGRLSEGALAGLKVSAQVAQLEAVPPEGWVLAMADAEEDPKRLRELVTRYRRVRVPLTGQALLELGVPPGPRLGKMLKNLRILALDEGMDVTDAQAWVRRVLAEGGHGG